MRTLFALTLLFVISGCSIFDKSPTSDDFKITGPDQLKEYEYGYFKLEIKDPINSTISKIDWVVPESDNHYSSYLDIETNNVSFDRYDITDLNTAQLRFSFNIKDGESQTIQFIAIVTLTSGEIVNVSRDILIVAREAFPEITGVNIPEEITENTIITLRATIRDSDNDSYGLTGNWFVATQGVDYKIEILRSYDNYEATLEVSRITSDKEIEIAFIARDDDSHEVIKYFKIKVKATNYLEENLDFTSFSYGPFKYCKINDSSEKGYDAIDELEKLGDKVNINDVTKLDCDCKDNYNTSFESLSTLTELKEIKVKNCDFSGGEIQSALKQKIEKIEIHSPMYSHFTNFVAPENTVIKHIEIIGDSGVVSPRKLPDLTNAHNLLSLKIDFTKSLETFNPNSLILNNSIQSLYLYGTDPFIYDFTEHPKLSDITIDNAQAVIFSEDHNIQKLNIRGADNQSGIYSNVSLKNISNNSLEKLILFDVNLYDFNTNNQPNIEYIALLDSNIISDDEVNIGNLNKLETLYIDCVATNIQSLLMVELDYINLKKCPGKPLDFNISGSNKLTYLNLEGNFSTSNLSITSSTSLEEVSIENGDILGLELNDLSNLKTLNLTGNFGHLEFSELNSPNIEVLSISNQNSITINGENLINLTDISVKNSEILSFNPPKSLKSINLENNTTTINSIKFEGNIRNVILANNNISEIIFHPEANLYEVDIEEPISNLNISTTSDLTIKSDYLKTLSIHASTEENTGNTIDLTDVDIEILKIHGFFYTIKLGGKYNFEVQKDDSTIIYNISYEDFQLTTLPEFHSAKYLNLTNNNITDINNILGNLNYIPEIIFLSGNAITNIIDITNYSEDTLPSTLDFGTTQISCNDYSALNTFYSNLSSDKEIKFTGTCSIN
ncbi:hypothetical protein [Marinicellulosiphila megalodicopiae]|uniref:hypothetical protein n=1 Tax=Marinicellulosiphila megalodicopiae TaxID=2724896 RepID=UPI003BB03AAD